MDLDNLRKIKSNLIKGARIIKEGNSFKDKLALFFFLLTKNPKLIFNTTIKNGDGVYYCGKRMESVWVASSFHEPYLKDFFNLNEGVFIDIGANIGKYSIKVGNRIKNKGKIIAIEPEPRNVKIIKKNKEIKIDVEGAELEVLKGAIKTLKMHPKVIFESRGKTVGKIKTLLKKFNYSVKRIDNKKAYYFAQ